MSCGRERGDRKGLGEVRSGIMTSIVAREEDAELERASAWWSSNLSQRIAIVGPGVENGKIGSRLLHVGSGSSGWSLDDVGRGYCDT